MKDEELKEKMNKDLDEVFDVKSIVDFQFDLTQKAYTKGLVTGLKAGRPQWHDLEKDPTDLPKDKHDVWCKWLDQYSEGWYDKDTDTWTLIYRGYHVHCIDAWCELPTFDKETE